MKRNVFVVLGGMMLFIGCTSTLKQNAENKYDYVALQDSISALLQYAVLHEDSAAMRNILQLTESVIVEDSVVAHLYNTFYLRSTIYSQLGDSMTADREYEKAMLLLPSNHIDRLTYYGKKCLNAGLLDSANNYLLNALLECDKKILERFDRNIFTKKILILTYLNRKDEAKMQLDSLLRDCPNDDLLQGLRDWIGESQGQVFDSSSNILENSSF